MSTRDEQQKPWGVYTVSTHTLVERFADFADANELKRSMGKAGVPCLVSNRPPRTARLSVAEKPLRAN